MSCEVCSSSFTGYCNSEFLVQGSFLFQYVQEATQGDNMLDLVFGNRVNCQIWKLEIYLTTVIINPLGFTLLLQKVLDGIEVFFLNSEQQILKV